jgi:nicotinic acid mononucleotide adenylyltransferase
MFPATAGHDEVVEQVLERLARDRHFQVLSMGEVGPAFEKRGPCIPAQASGGR